MSSLALPRPTIRARRWVPPQPGVMPRPTSGWPNTALSDARRISQLIASSQPPPRQKPLIAAITGRLKFSIFQQTRLELLPNTLPCSTVRVDISEMSAPATKELTVLPFLLTIEEPVRTTA